jgi:hypothetical protein
MRSMIADARTAVSDQIVRRTGQFAVGTFAGICAAFVPRLTLMIGPPAHSAAVNVEALPATYVVAALVFSLLIGGVAVILEWDGARTPRDTFMAALGVPALLTGVFSTANLSGEALRYAEKVKQISDERVIEEQIPVEGGPQASLAPAGGGWLSGLHVIPTAFAHELAVPVPVAYEPRQEKRGPGVRYREPRYWVVLDTFETEADAKKRAAQLGSRYGALRVFNIGKSYFVCPSEGSFPYSAAVSKAVEIKRQSEGALGPKLVRVE